MVIAHLADLHISKYGTKMTALHHGRIKAATGRYWEKVWTHQGWRIDERRRSQTLGHLKQFRLVDSEGRVHRTVKAGGSISETKIIESLQMFRSMREQTASYFLARHWPSKEKLCQLLDEDPENGNARFCAVAEQLCQDQPDWIIITGDLTDDGIGYDLIQTGLQSFIKNKRLICIPGNHDLYPTPPLWNANALRKSLEEKKILWANFVQHLALPHAGSYVVALSENVMLAYLDSLHPSQLPGSSSGLLPIEELKAIKQQMDKLNPGAVKLACLHHPILNLSLKELGLINFQPGMRLRNAKKVLNHIKSMGFSAVLKGHRHVGYQYQLPSGPVFLSAPSTTYGCRSGVNPFYWSIKMNDQGIESIDQQFISLLDNELHACPSAAILASSGQNAAGLEGERA